MGAVAHVGPLALVLVAFGLVVLAAWELRLWRVRCGVRAGRVPLVTCRACRRRVSDTWPRLNTSKTCAVCARVRQVGSWRRAAHAAQPRRIGR